jgi:hypothetical protein
MAEIADGIIENIKIMNAVVSGTVSIANALIPALSVVLPKETVDNPAAKQIPNKIEIAITTTIAVK